MMKLTTIFTATLFSLSLAAQADAPKNNNILFIVDASGSMKEKVGEQTRMDAAKEVLGKTLSEMPDNMNLGLMAYGHRTAKDCADIELIAPVGSKKASDLQATIAGLTAKGETPIAESLMQAAASFDGTGKIILVTDGLEECKGDPCAAAQAIKNKGLDVAVDVVGFTLGEKEAEAMQCITQTTGGAYYGAADADALTKALQKAAEPKQELIFEETFDSEESVAANWTINNEDDEGYIIEDGELVIVSAKKDLKTSPYYPNSFALNKELPAGDWKLNVIFTPENGGYTDFGFVFGDVENTEKVKHMLAGTKTEYGNKVSGGFWLNSKGKETKEWDKVSNQYDNSWTGAQTRFETAEKFEMQIARTGREYIMKMRGADKPDGEWTTLATIGVIKPFKKVHLALGTNNNGHKSASSYKIDKVSLYKVGE